MVERHHPDDHGTPDWLRWAAAVSRAVGLTTSLLAAVVMLVALIAVAALLLIG